MIKEAIRQYPEIEMEKTFKMKQNQSEVFSSLLKVA